MRSQMNARIPNLTRLEHIPTPPQVTSPSAAMDCGSESQQSQQQPQPLIVMEDPVIIAGNFCHVRLANGLKIHHGLKVCLCLCACVCM